MYKVWVEYHIMPESRESYLRFMEKKLRDYKHLELYEGTDQPGLFVEQWDALDHEEYLLLKGRRKDEDEEEWAEFTGYVKGGISKINIWHFTQI
ncbi:hypothetical protein NV379_21865 [Paenibacillus sp. N1-5-1-14]|uniref:hypothetical protein n=1 Tax=Paenibacillus radicibacter TaxID=2972488 RepID=UPI0021594671|nr:hypothetical protein [Paenibacillus radicibacter]MCR8645308.1 hypothetical protein [Paenibacillus radicibacter]